jgi:hypothetical protein
MKVFYLATLVLAADTLLVFSISDAPTLEYESGGVISMVEFFIQVLLKPLAFKKYLAFSCMFWGISNTLIEALFGKRVVISKFIYFFKMQFLRKNCMGK